VYIVTVTLAGLVAVAAATATARAWWTPRDAAVWLALLGCAVVTVEAAHTAREVYGGITRDLLTVWYLAAAVTLPPVYAFLAPVLVLGYRLARNRQGQGFTYRRVFSNATLALGYGAASLVFHAAPTSVAGPHPGTGLHALTWTGLVAGCGVLGYVINEGLLAGAIYLADPAVPWLYDAYGRWPGLIAVLIELSMAVSVTVLVALSPFLMVLGLPSVLLYRRYLTSAQLATAARIDAATGVLYAPVWRREADSEALQARRKNTPLALVVAEIDHFGAVRQTASREAADQVLRRVVGILTETLPRTGLAGQVGRVGGEEFAFTLSGVNETQARRLGERIRDRIAGEPIATEGDSDTGFVYRLSMSVGIAAPRSSGQTLAELRREADAALAEAKAAGTGQVRVFAPGHTELPGPAAARPPG
jgi:diguanylate cyclase (GGDEF)-like protein